jgi:cellulose synthase/poly-beta-1,6-N-acetylglucosamine synthase-like glycosyltransferase
MDPAAGALPELVVAAYSLLLAALALYGLHSLGLLAAFLRHRRVMVARERAEAERLPDPAGLPHMLVQLPVFNERDVVARVVAAAGALEWPRERLHVQLLDDSDDDTAERGAAAIATLRASGLDAVVVRRAHRDGYKAGALAHGLSLNDAPFVALFDADFMPAPGFLRRAMVPLLEDPGLALVQGRWEHLDREAGALAGAQALGIDGHFAIEQAARAWSGLAMNFNGTGGVWRRAAIDDAGGWQADTLTEDLDLSYRAQLAGWRCTFRVGLTVPGELPASLGAWRSQQARWAAGSLQTLVKLARPLWRSRWPLPRRLAALLHLSHYLVHPLILLAVLAAPLALWAVPLVAPALALVPLALFIVGAAAPVVLVVAAQLALHGRGGWHHLRHLPAFTALGTGLAASNARAAWSVLRGHALPFVRTPKRGGGAGSYRAAGASGWPELALAGWSAMGMVAAGWWSQAWIAPLLWLSTAGFAWVGWSTLRERASLLHGRQQLGGLPLLGLASLAGYAVLAAQPGSWRDQPLLFAGIGLALGATYLLALALVRRRPAQSLAWILAVAVGMRLLALGLAPSDDLARYAIEGRQLAIGENPYAIAPQDSAALAGLPAAVVAPLNHGEWTAIYPPLTLVFEALVAAIDPRPLAFKLAALALDLLVVVLGLRLLRRHGLPATLVLALAWNPVGPLFIAGEGHHEALMAALLLAGLLLGGVGGVAATSLAALAKPLAVLALLLQLLGRRWWWWLLPPAIALAAYLPFSAAGIGTVHSLGRFAGSMHFHGALEPLVAEVWRWVVPLPLVRPLTLVCLVALLAAGAALVLRQRVGVPPPLVAARLLAVTLLCLPTLHPWYFAPLVALLPFTRSWALAAWTAAAPAYWLHGVAMHGSWSESPLVTAAAHLPMVALLAWEASGRPTWRGLPRAGRMPS